MVSLEKTPEEKQKENGVMVSIIHQHICIAMRDLIEKSIAMAGDCAITCEKERDEIMEAVKQKGRFLVIDETLAVTIEVKNLPQWLHTRVPLTIRGS
jgi:hypothetical protein